MFHLIFSLPGWYVIARFIIPLPITMTAKILLSVLVLSATQFLIISRFTSGSVFSAEMPRIIIILFNWAFCSVLFIALMQLLLDLVILTTLLFHHPLSGLEVVRYTLAFVAMAVAAVGVTQAIRIPRLKEVAITINNLPAEFEGFRMLQLTDLHLSRLFNAGWSSVLVEKVAELDVDLIVITGDVVDGTVQNRRNDVEPLRRLNAPDGVLAVTGNHEYFFEQQRWTEHLNSLGLKTLLNNHAVICRGDAKLVIAGVTDASAGRRGAPGSDLTKALADTPQDAPVILLDHQPRNARRNAEQGVDLQLSGHTHGGLIAGFDRLFAGANGGFVSGRYDVAGMQLYVNNGTALWPGMAIRLGRPSELTRITLKRAIQ
ncbi:metallophosphoesterase [Erwinia mallotivora]|uniref:Metallophosphoesterase n=1 Tax=Erwinia mallotivora TaxID=69222 RepID=A0A014Q186_9GAMM|nr:metallophosphoesterase [Erwinia mallotivora]EXU76947.1 metallophosphoesterase [Erwinia mallotivora]